MNFFDIIDSLLNLYKITKPIRLIELFAGIGSQAKALKNLGADFEHYKVCEFDKYAITSYNAIHGTDFEPSDITQLTAKELNIVDTDKYEYIMTYSFPCQDLSLAGDRKGMNRDANTRSGLLWEVERLLKECENLPQILLMENVTQVRGTKNFSDFYKWEQFLASLGYKNFVADLNARHYGIPQNRDRTFMVSILNTNKTYNFPDRKKLTLKLQDYLEKDVSENYYISGKMKEYLTSTETNGYSRAKAFDSVFRNTNEKGIAATINTRAGQRPVDNFIIEPQLEQAGKLSGGKWDKMHDMSRRVYDTNGISPTIHTMGGGNLEPKILVDVVDNEIRVKQATQKGYIECKNGGVADLSYPNSELRRGRVQGGGDISPTLTTSSQVCQLTLKEELVNSILENNQVEEFDVIQHSYSNHRMETGKVVKEVFEENKDDIIASNKDIWSINTGTCFNDTKVGIKVSPTIRASNSHTCSYDIKNLQIRKLTPRECFRLMGFSDHDFDLAQNTGMSNAQLYKQAGNSIVVNVLMGIFENLL